MRIAKDLLSEFIHPLSPADTGVTALHWFDEYKLTHLPVVENRLLKGILSEEDVYNNNSFEEPVNTFIQQLKNISVNQSGHFYDVINLFSHNKLTLLPVTDDNNVYTGSIIWQDLISHIADLVGASEQGGIIVLELNEKDVSISDISRIVESNNFRIINLYTTYLPESTLCEVTLKINSMDIQPVLQSLYRFNYTVKASYFASDYFEGLRERYNNLMNYLNI